MCRKLSVAFFCWPWRCASRRKNEIIYFRLAARQKALKPRGASTAARPLRWIPRHAGLVALREPRLARSSADRRAILAMADRTA